MRRESNDATSAFSSYRSALLKSQRLCWPLKLVLTCFLLFPVLTNPSPAKAAEIVVSYTTVQHEARPRQGGLWDTAVRIHLKLQGGNVLGETVYADNLHGRTRTVNREGRFRDSMTVSTTRGNVGPLGGVSWTVEDSKTLARRADASQHIHTIRVIITSDTTCRADVSYHLKPGFREYKFTSIKTGVPIYLSSIRARNITCRVAP